MNLATSSFGQGNSGNKVSPRFICRQQASTPLVDVLQTPTALGLATDFILRVDEASKVPPLATPR